MTNIFTNYIEQLESPEWKSRRDEILKRDENKCSFCGKGPTVTLHFGDLSFYIGVDHFKSEVDCSKADFTTATEFLSYMKAKSKRGLKGGALSNSDYIFFFSEDCDFFYSPWKKNDNYKSLVNKAHIAKVQCDDGITVNVLFIDKKELNDLKLPRVYIQRSPLVLQVHHKRYFIDKRAWEYEDNDLVTLCQECHLKVHKFFPVQVYAYVDGQMKVMNYTPCQRCNGTGYFPEYKNIQGGVCFRCHGVRFEELIPNKNETVDLGIY